MYLNNASTTKTDDRFTVLTSRLQRGLCNEY